MAHRPPKLPKSLKVERRGAIASDAQRKPGIRLSKEAIAEIEFLIARLERNT